MCCGMCDSRYIVSILVCVSMFCFSVFSGMDLTPCAHRTTNPYLVLQLGDSTVSTNVYECGGWSNYSTSHELILCIGTIYNAIYSCLMPLSMHDVYQSTWSG